MIAKFDGHLVRAKQYIDFFDMMHEIPNDRREARKSMLDAYPNLRGMYNEDDGNTAVLYFENATATFCSFPAAPRIIKF